MAEVPYIWLMSSDSSVQERFRVLQQGYNDGQLEKAESLNRTIGGGLDHSMGAVYRSWNPVIRVRETEPETDYGDLDDLEYFYNLNDPGGTPSNIISFVDHHQISFYVRIHGTFQKSILGSMTEGNQAWFLVKLNLLEVPTV